MSFLFSYLEGLTPDLRHSHKLLTMPGPHLCTLPAETRGLIISKGMEGAMTIVEDNNDSSGHMRFSIFYRIYSTPNALGLLRTCRSLREETYAYLGANVPLWMPTTYFDMRNPLTVLPPAYKTKVRHIKVNLGYCPDLPWAVKNLPSLRKLHLDYKDRTMDAELSEMVGDGDLTLGDIIKHENLDFLHDAVVKAHRRHLYLIAEDMEERSWTLTTRLNCGPFEAELHPLQPDTDNNACEPNQVDEYQNHEGNDIEDNHSEGSEGTATDDSYDSDDAEVLRGLILVRQMPRSRGHTDGLQKAKVRETADGVIRASLCVNPDLIKIHQHDELGKVGYFEIDDVRVF